MKSELRNMRISILAVAVQSALFAMCAMPAHAEDDELATLLKPTNTLEIGVANVSSASAKFGEYSGMNKKGAKFVGNVNLNGGDSYSNDTSSKRWSFTATDLGLTSRALGATVKDQGKWNFGFGYDELRHNTSDTYQTPYIGSMGGNSFTLPAGFVKSTTTAAGTAPVGTRRASWIASNSAVFNTEPIYNDRKNASLTAGLALNDQTSLKFDFNHLVQSGAKLMAFGSMANSVPPMAAALTGVTGEAVSILPNPTNYKTDTFTLGLNWIGDQGHLSTSYFGSFFKEGYDRVAFETFAGSNVGSINQLMSTAPSNQLHQLNLNGGYSFSSDTKLTGGLSYGRNTQNDAYVVDAYSMIAPSPMTSLNGLVFNTHADLKLTNQTTQNLTMSAGVKFDERNDKTASNFYSFNALSGANNQQANFANTPYSNRKTQVELAGDYRLDKDQALRIAYNREEIQRWCNQYAVRGPITVGTVPGINSYPAGTNCVVATGSHDDKLSATYRDRSSEALSWNIGYSFAKRYTSSDPNAVTARFGLNGNPNLAAAAGTQFQGLNAGDYRGFYPVFSASRKEQMVKAGANWQATEKVSVMLGGKFTDDKYDSLYGVQKGNSWSVNLDTTYAYSEKGLVTAFISQQQRKRDMTDLYRSPQIAASGTLGGSATALNIPAGATWSDTQKDVDSTVGIGAKQGGLFGSKLDLDGSLTYTMGKTGYTTVFNYAAATSGGLTCDSPQFRTCGALPEIQNTVTQFKLIGKYNLDKQSKVAVGYLYQHMKSTDYYYNGVQMGYTPTALMPTNQQSPNYTVNVISVSYILDL